MKSRCTGATRRISITRGTVLGLAVIAMIALTSVLVWGCGESASQPQDPTAGPTQPVAAESSGTTSGAAEPVVTTPDAQIRPLVSTREGHGRTPPQDGGRG